MKKIFALFVLLAVTVWGQSQELDLGGHGKLSLFLLDDGWKFNVADYGDRLLVTIAPAKSDVNASCSLTITYPERDRYDTPARLKMEVETRGETFASQSVEGKAYAQEYNLRGGFGFHCDFTDPSLVGKPPQKGNFKTISAGLVHLAPDVLLEIGISADGFKSAPYQALLGMIEGMEFTAPGGGRNR
jgi:hypothetical protein